MASPTEVTVFGGYFPFATKHILDVPVLFNQYGLADIWREEYAKVGVTWLSSVGQDPCNFNTKKEITSVADLNGLKLYTFPTAGRFLAQFALHARHHVLVGLHLPAQAVVLAQVLVVVAGVAVDQQDAAAVGGQDVAEGADDRGVGHRCSAVGDRSGD